MTTLETVRPEPEFVGASPGSTPTPALGQRRRRFSRSTPSTVLWFVGISVLTIVVLYPLAWMFSASFKPNSEFGSNQGFLPENPTIQNYISVLEGVAGIPLGQFFLNSLLLAVGAVVGTVISSSMAAYAFARLDFRGRPLFFAVMIGTLLLPRSEERRVGKECPV